MRHYANVPRDYVKAACILCGRVDALITLYASAMLIMILMGLIRRADTAR
jgi:hypothetical protein